jgi:ATP-dependent Clp protease adaptor protein ClpS
MNDGMLGAVRSGHARPNEEAKTATAPRTARPWNVVVHDDPVTLMTYVTSVFMKVFGYSHTQAHRLMMEVHTTGRSIVWTGGREQAEIYVHKLQSYYLIASLEPVEG